MRSPTIRLDQGEVDQFKRWTRAVVTSSRIHNYSAFVIALRSALAYLLVVALRRVWFDFEDGGS